MAALRALGGILALSIMVIMHSPLAQCALVNPADGVIMMRLKASYSSTLPVDMATWDLANDCKTWSRTQCDGDRISKLDFANTKVGGDLPEYITGLSSLRLIYADGSGWSGPVPDSFSVLTKLQLIKMGGNKLTGVLPSSWSVLRSLYKLGLGNNKLSGAVPTTWTTFNLQEFYADSAGLSGPFPTIVCNWTILEVLRIGGNPWIGPIPDCIGNINTKLKKLYLDNCGPTISSAIPPSLGNLVNLEEMFLNGNNLTGPIPEAVGGMRKLRSMFLSGNQITGPLPQSMGALTELTQWTMEFNKIDGTIPDTIGNMTNVQRILLDNNLLSGLIPASLGNLKKLTILLLEGNQLYGPVPPEIASGCSSLVQLNVESNYLSGIPPGGFASSRIAAGQVNYRSNIFSGAPTFSFDNGTKFCPPYWPNSWIHSSVKFNCFSNTSSTGCADNDQELKGGMHSRAVCAAFCGADNPLGPCDGKGYCLPNRTCVCSSGYQQSLTSSNISTCVVKASSDALALAGLTVEGTTAVNAAANAVENSGALSIDIEPTTIDSGAMTKGQGGGFAGKSQRQGVSTLNVAAAEVGIKQLGTCDLGNDTLCPIDVDCLDTEGLMGCACLSGDSTAPSCLYSKICLDKNECPVLAQCLYSHGKTTCTCKPGYRPLMAALEPNESHFQYCAKTKCTNLESFTGFSCFSVEGGSS